MSLAWLILLVASAVLAVVAVGVFKLFSSPIRIREQRNRMLARFVELFLYQESLRALIRSGGRLGVSLFRYLLALILPLFAAAVAVIPLLLLIAPLLAWRPIAPNETFLIEVGELEGGQKVELVGDGVIATAPPVRIPSENRILWRCASSREGLGKGTLASDMGSVSISIEMRGGCPWISPTWSASPVAFIVPQIRGLEGDVGFRRIDISYPKRRFQIADFELDWLSAISLFSLIFSIPVALLLRITI